MAGTKSTRNRPAVETPPRALPAILGNHYLYVGLMAAIVAFLFGPFLFSDDMLFGSDTMGSLDARVYYRDAVVNHGQFPMWLSCRLGGMPTVDAMFGDAMYPPSMALSALAPVHRSLGYRLILHVLLAGVFFYLMLHLGFRAPPPVAFIGAAFYMLNPEFVSHVYPGHDGKMYVIAWLPFVIWRLKELMDRPGLLGATLLSLGIAMMLYTSHIQMTYFTLWGLFLYWVLSIVLQWRKERSVRALAPFALYFWLAVALGMGAALIQFLPPFMYVREAFSVRGVERGFEYASSWSLHWPEFFSLWIPEFGSYLDYYWSENAFKLNTEYAGAMALLLAVFGVIRKPGHWRIFWAGVGVLAVLFALGSHTPVFHVAYYLIPGVKKMRACSMMMLWFSFAVALLAGLFMRDVWVGKLSSFGEPRKKRWSRNLLIALAVVTGLCLIFSAKGFVEGLMSGLVESLADPRKKRAFDLNFSKNFVPWLWIWWVFAATVIGLLWGVVNGKIPAGVWLSVVLAIGLVDTVRVDRTFIKTVPYRQYLSIDPSLRSLGESMPSNPFRCLFLPGTFSQNNAEGVQGLEGIGDFHDNELRWYRDYRGERDNRNYMQGLLGSGPNGQAYLIPSRMRQGNNFLNIANVRYFVTRQRSGLVAVENEGALGRISFAPTCTVLSEEQVAAALSSDSHDPRQAVILIDEPERIPPPLAAPDSGETPILTADVTWERYTPNDRRATVTVPREGFLRISEVWYPGWEILLDGARVKAYRADLAWMAVAVNAGSHTLEIRPQSLYLRKASFVSVPVIVALLLFWAWSGWRFAQRRNASTATETAGPHA